MSKLLEQLRTVPWYDRNAQSKADWYAATLGPHATAIRKTYKCPNGKKAMLEVLQCKLLRETAATSVAAAAAWWSFIPLGGVDTLLLYSRIITNEVGDQDSKAIGASLTMCEGDQLVGTTMDLSTDGSIFHHITYKLTEFDAFPIEEVPFRVKMPVKDIQEPDSVVKGQM